MLIGVVERCSCSHGQNVAPRMMLCHRRHAGAAIVERAEKEASLAAAATLPKSAPPFCPTIGTGKDSATSAANRTHKSPRHVRAVARVTVMCYRMNGSIGAGINPLIAPGKKPRRKLHVRHEKARVHHALGGAAAWPLAARAQQPAQVARIGCLVTGSLGSSEARAMVDAFRQGLGQRVRGGAEYRH